MPEGLNALARECHSISVDHGWWDTNDGAKAIEEKAGRNFGELLMLIVTEVAEAMEEYRNGVPVNVFRYQHPDGSVIAYSTDSDEKPVGIPSEIADIIIRCFDLCGAYDIDIERAVREKMDYNRTREMRHGGKIA